MPSQYLVSPLTLITPGSGATATSPTDQSLLITDTSQPYTVSCTLPCLPPGGPGEGPGPACPSLLLHLLTTPRCSPPRLRGAGHCPSSQETQWIPLWVALASLCRHSGSSINYNPTGTNGAESAELSLRSRKRSDFQRQASRVKPAMEQRGSACGQSRRVGPMFSLEMVLKAISKKL